MKTKALFIFCILYALNSQAQLKQWIQAPKEHIFNSNGTWNSTTFGGTANPFYDGNGIYDANNQLHFYVNGNGVFNSNGQFGTLSGWASGTSQTEVAIVPFVQNCFTNNYYIFYTDYSYNASSSNNHVHLRGAIVSTNKYTGEMTLQNIMDPTTGQVKNLATTTATYPNVNGGAGIAVSKTIPSVSTPFIGLV